jgi:hypothetical protein
MVASAEKSFWKHPMVLLGNKAQVEVRSVQLEIVVILMQDSCTVCTKYTIGLEIVLDAPDGTLR